MNIIMSDLITLKDPRSPVSEAFRTIRTNIQFSTSDNKIKVIAVTSSGPSEGKSTTAANLAIVTAENGKRTIIVDCDQRKPKIHRTFGVSNQIGLSNYLVGEVSFEGAIQKSIVDNLFIMSSGKIPPNPAELLSSKKMQDLIIMLKEKFDFIILDTPPVIAVTDALIISHYVDGVLLVVCSGKAEKEATIRAKNLLESNNAKIIGAVLNKVSNTGRKGYYNYYYEYYSSDGTKKRKRKHKSY